jgi:hypothetical protein
MESFEGSRRRSTRPAAAERRFASDPEAIEQRLERWMSAGRQLVDGVSGGRPGSRPTGRRPEGRGGSRSGFDGLGRWVEDRLDWLLDDSDDWREPWQERPQQRSGGVAADRSREPDPAPVSAAAGRPRRPLEARSRRPLEATSRRSDRPASAAALETAGPVGPGALAAPPDPDDWPGEDSFRIPRWQRPPASEAPRSLGAPPDPVPELGSRPLPRSTRRR